MTKMSFTTFGTQPHLNTLHMYNKIQWLAMYIFNTTAEFWLAAGFFGSK